MPVSLIEKLRNYYHDFISKIPDIGKQEVVKFRNYR
jgi:hypothetical protein